MPNDFRGKCATNEIVLLNTPAGFTNFCDERPFFVTNRLISGDKRSYPWNSEVARSVSNKAA